MKEALVVVAALCGCTHPTDIGPGSSPPPGLCDSSQFSPSLPPLGEGEAVCTPNGPVPCDCEAFTPDYPPGVTDWHASGMDTTGAPVLDNGRVTGCSSITHYQWPDCATVAETSAVVMNEPSLNFGLTDDDDYTFNTCPDPASMRVDPFTSNPMEIRNQGSWDDGNSAPNGRIHMEIQDCRYYRGTWTVNDPAVATQPMSFDARPHAGDTISAAGDWLADDHYESNSGGHGGHTELHEARIIAKTVPASSTVSYSFVSAIFAQQSRQANEITLDVKVPPSPGPSFNKLKCDIVAETGSVVQATNMTSVGKSCGVLATLDAAIGDGGTATCRLHLTDPLRPSPFNCQGTCEFEIPDQPGTFTRHPFGRCDQVFTCDAACQGLCNPPLQPFEQPSAGRCPMTISIDCSLAMSDCDRLGAVFAVRAEWLDPGDIWVCDNCACGDPSAEGATIVAPVQGCATLGLDPSSSAAQEEVCAQVCGSLICGAASSCLIGECSAPITTATAHLVGRNSCDPTQAPSSVRVTPAGDRHITLDSSLSSTTISLSDDHITRAVSGEFVVNISDDGEILDFSRAIVETPTFSIHDHTVADGRIFTVQRLFGDYTSAPAFVIPAGIGVFGIRATVDGSAKGLNTVNASAILGTLDINTGHFTMDISAADPDESEATLTAHLEGNIDDSPPVARAGGPLRTVECTSHTTTPVVLDGLISSDPDPGDSISHYQWFTGSGAAVGNHGQEHVSIPLGQWPYVLHVYDGELGSSKDNVAIRVQDTTPPELTLAPQNVCIWPPNHKRIKFVLGQDVQVAASDVCDPSPSVKIISVTSNEADNGLGDGDTAHDTSFSDKAFCVRRERGGNGDGRQYTVTVKAQDASGNSTVRNVVVSIPHDHQQGCTTAGVAIDELDPCN